MAHENVGFDPGTDDLTSKLQSSRQPSLIWRNVQYKVDSGFVSRNKKQILQPSNGFFDYHSINGIMGPSGAGKTTLLHCLSGRNRVGLHRNSEIYLNSTGSELVNFVEQHVHESIPSCLTVGEILRYAFAFKNLGKFKSEYIEQYIRDIISELMLDKEVLNRKFENCSGGEQKRISIGQELMGQIKPVLLFVDEPTTGLDSAAAIEVMACLRQLTHNYTMTVIASIHTPSQEVLHLFDKLYVLARGGVCIFSGSPKSITIESLIPLPTRQAPIEGLLKLACNGLHDKKVQFLSKLMQDTGFQQASGRIQQYSPNLTTPTIQTKRFSFSDLINSTCRLFRLTFISQIHIHCALIILHLAYFLWIATVFRSDLSTQSGCVPLNSTDFSANLTCAQMIANHAILDENILYLGYALLYSGAVFILSSALMFGASMQVFRSEHRNHWYSTGAFYFSSTLISMIELFFYGALISSLAYFLTGQHLADPILNWSRFLLFASFLALGCLYSQSIGQLVATLLLDHQELVLIASIVCYIFASLLNGFFVDPEAAGSVLVVTISKLTAFKFVSYGILYSIYSFERCDFGTETSSTYSHFHIQPELIWHYTSYLFIFIATVRVVTFVYLLFKCRYYGAKKSINANKDRVQQILIDFSTKQSHRNPSVFISPPESSETIPESKDSWLRSTTIIGWTNLTLYQSISIYELGLNRPETRMPILRNLKGSFRFGSLNALMGTSGAGKTTLLRVLNGQFKTRMSSQTQFHLSKYCPIESRFIAQDVSGHLWTGLTSNQLLLYASRLKNRELDLQEHAKIVENLMNEMDISGAADTRVENCSGGERKRLALALELTSVRMPNLICIDEPTSGLDSNSAEKVIACLKRLTLAHNITIAVSIHQPNSDLLEQFDQLYVLSRGGACVYSGPPGLMIQERLNQIQEIGKSKIAIEQLIRHSCAGHENVIVQKLIAIEDEHFDSAKLCKETSNTPDGIALNRTRFSMHSIWILSLRYFVYIRSYLWIQLLFFTLNYLCYGYALSSLYDLRMVNISGCLDFNSDDLSPVCSKNAKALEEQDLLTNNVKYSYYLITFYLFFIMLQSPISLMSELIRFENEHHNGWYSTGSFYLVRSLFEALPLIPLNLLYVYIINHYEHIRPGIFWELAAILTLSSMAIQGLAHLITVLCRNSTTFLMILIITIYLFLALLSNFFLPISQLHYAYQFISNFSIVRFTFECAMILQYGLGRCPPKSVQAVLYNANINDRDFTSGIVMLLFNLILYRTTALVCLVKLANPSENRREQANRIVQHRKSLANENPQIIPTLGGTVVQQFRIRLNSIY